MTDPDKMSTEELLREQLRLARKADRRGGCLWNIVMFILFGLFYLAWLGIKRLAKWTWWVLVFLWAATKWIWRGLILVPAMWTWRKTVQVGGWVAGKVRR